MGFAPCAGFSCCGPFYKPPLPGDTDPEPYPRRGNLTLTDTDHDDVLTGKYEDLYDIDEPEFVAFSSMKRQARIRRERAVIAPPENAAALEASSGENFITTYHPSRHERTWLLSSLQPFYTQNLITDVLASVKGGKEASVYRCAAHPATGQELIAAKVYRPRQFRNLRNDKMYREGRPVLTAEGHQVKKSEHRIMRALGKNTAFGQAVAHTSWLMYEYTTLETLYAAGAAVPKPYGAAENAILMEYAGDEHGAAPTLIETSLETDEAERLLKVTLSNIEIMLQHNVIHGDLSAYNILYWEGRITLIDFPQVVSIDTNPNARAILERDITRVCEYFARQGARLPKSPSELLDEFWDRYGVDEL